MNGSFSGLTLLVLETTVVAVVTSPGFPPATSNSTCSIRVSMLPRPRSSRFRAKDAVCLRTTLCDWSLCFSQKKTRWPLNTAIMPVAGRPVFDGVNSLRQGFPVFETPQQVVEGLLESARERRVERDSGVFGTKGMAGEEERVEALSWRELGWFGMPGFEG